MAGNPTTRPLTVKLNYRDVLRSHASTHRAAIDKEYVINPSQPLVGEPKRNGVVFWSRKTALAILGTLVTLALVGACYQAIQTKVDLRRFPPRGRFVDLGGYKLDINCTGHGSPTVILESELGGLALSWQRVQSGIEKFTRVCSYDRAGYGVPRVCVLWGRRHSNPDRRHDGGMDESRGLRRLPSRTSLFPERGSRTSSTW